MRHMIVYFLLLGLMACAAKPSTVEAPLGEEEFVAVLTDIRLLEGMYSQNYGGINRVQLASWYTQIFKRHGVSRDDFQTSLMAYNLDPDRMLRLEEAVLERLNVLEAGSQMRNESDTLSVGEK